MLQHSKESMLSTRWHHTQTISLVRRPRKAHPTWHTSTQLRNITAHLCKCMLGPHARRLVLPSAPTHWQTQPTMRHTYTHTHTHTHVPTKGGAKHASQLWGWHVVCIWPRLSADGHVAWSSETHIARPTSIPQANNTQHLCMGMLQHMHMPTSPLKGGAHPTYPHIHIYTHNAIGLSSGRLHH